VTNQIELDKFIWHCCFWFLILCQNPVFVLYRTTDGLGIGVRLREYPTSTDGKWTVDQIRVALFMVAQVVINYYI